MIEGVEDWRMVAVGVMSSGIKMINWCFSLMDTVSRFHQQTKREMGTR